MERLKHIKDSLIAQVQTQMSNLQYVDAEELGEVVDMIKDLEEAIYYCSITKAMEEKEKEQKYGGNDKETYYYTERYMPEYYPMMERDMDRPNGRMYYPGGNSSGNSSGGGSNGSSGSSGNSGSNSSSGGNNSRGGGTRGFSDGYETPLELRDRREGRSPLSRKTYMESKEMNHDKVKKMKDLESYLQELSTDVMEMIQDASPEEKQLLQKKISMLATKIQ